MQGADTLNVYLEMQAHLTIPDGVAHLPSCCHLGGIHLGHPRHLWRHCLLPAWH